MFLKKQLDVLNESITTLETNLSHKIENIFQIMILNLKYKEFLIIKKIKLS